MFINYRTCNINVDYLYCCCYTYIEFFWILIILYNFELFKLRLEILIEDFFISCSSDLKILKFRGYYLFIFFDKTMKIHIWLLTILTIFLLHK